MQTIHKITLALATLILLLSQPVFAASINVTNGNLFDRLSVSPLPKLPVSLAYNSHSTLEGLFGYGWSSNVDIRLRHNSPTSVTLVYADGKERLFTSAGNGTFSAPADVHDTLVKTGDTYRLTSKHGDFLTFSAAGLLLSMSDLNGNVTALGYIGGNLATLTGPDGDQLAFAADSAGKITSISGAGKTWALTYDAGKNLIAITNPIGNITSFTYDAGGKRISTTNPAGGVTSYVYDSLDRVVSFTDPVGATSTFSYTITSSKPVYVPMPTEAKRHVIDSEPANIPIKAQATDPAGNVTTYLFGTNQKIAQKIDALGNTTAITWDAALNKTSITDASGTVNMSYDNNGNLTRRVDQLGQATSYAYNNLSQVIGSTDPMGAQTSLLYDAKGNLVAATDPLANTTQLAYDSRGRVIAVTEPTGSVTRLAYDASGNVASQTNPLGAITALAHDLSGNLTRLTDANSHATTTAYDLLNRPVSATDALGGITRIQYDALGNPAAVTDAKGRITIFAYDVMGRLLQETDPAGRRITYQYNLGGKLASRTDAKGNTIRYTYDALGRLIAKTMPDGTSTTYGYDAKGRITYALNGDNGYSLTWDAVGRMLSSIDTSNRLFAYQYDAAGRRTQMTAPDGKVQTYTYDQAHRLTGLDSFLGAFSFTYDANGRRIGLRQPNNIETSYQYDAAGRLTGIIANNNLGEALAGAAYTLDAVGNRVQRASLLRNDTYTYDPTDQVTKAVKQLLDASSAVTKTQQEQYSYDGVGNREIGLKPKKPTVYDNANQLISDKNFTYQYDANGNLTSKIKSHPVVVNPEDDSDAEVLEPVVLDPDVDTGVKVGLDQPATTETWHSYEWDYENRLSKVTRNTPKQVVFTSFKYDPFGRRIEKRVATTNILSTKTSVIIHEYLYDNEDIVEEIIIKPRPQRDIVEETSFVHGPGIDEPLAFSGKQGEYFFHADGLGSITALTDHGGGLAQRYEYSAFGTRKKHDSGVDSFYSYTGREWDSETGLYYYRARYYDSAAGRFIGKDPIGFAGGDVNLYRYVQNQPVNWVDPSGLMSPEEGRCVAACMADRALVMNLPLLNLFPFDLAPIQTLTGYEVPFVSGGASDATASASEINARGWKGINALLTNHSVESALVKLLAKGSGITNLAIAAWDFTDDLADCSELCKLKKCEK